MNWNAIGAVAEIVGAAGVVVSLVYLAIQIRRNSSDTRHASVDRLVEMWSSHIGGFAENPQVAELWVRSLTGMESLSREEQAVLFAFIARMLRISEAIHIHHMDGTVDAGLWSGIDAALTDIVATESARQYWKIRRHWFGPQFQKYLSERIESREGIEFYPIDHSA